MAALAGEIQTRPMMRVVRPVFLGVAAILVAGAFEVRGRSASLVESGQTIDESAARLELARTMAQVPAHRAEALQVYLRIVGPESASPLLRERRDVAVKLGQLDVAAADFARLDRRGDLRLAETQWYVAILEKLGRWREAAAIFERGIDAPDVRAETLETYVELARRAGEIDVAERRLTTLATRHPRQPAFALEAAELAAERNDSVTAGRILAAARAGNPENAAILVRLGDRALAAGKEDEALDLYGKAVALAPGDLDLRRKAARTAHDAGRPAQARLLLKPVFSAAPGAGQTAARLEESAAQAQEDRHPREAARLYAEAARLEPESLSHLYGMAGAQRSAGDLVTARESYGKIRRQNPDQAFARIAVQSLDAAARARVRTAYLFENQDSPDRLTDVARSIISATYEMPVGDAFRFAVGPQFWIESPGGGARPYFAAGGSVLATWKPNPDWKWQLDYTFKDYATASLRDTHTGGVAATWHPADPLFLTAEYRREDVLPNRYAYAQNIQAGVARLSLDSPVNRWLQLSANAALRHYNDANLEFESEAAAGMILVQNPGRLMAEIRGRFLTTKEESVIQDSGGGEIDIVHPYWTPRDYFRGLIGLFWDQSLGRSIDGLDAPFSYRAGVQTSLDTEGNPAIALRGGLRGAVGSHVTVDLSGAIERSVDWNGASAFVSFEYAF